MPDPAVDKFGRLIVTRLRDRAIDFYDLAARGHWKSPGLRRLQAGLAKMTPAQLAVVRECMVRTIDTAMHDFLVAMEEASGPENGVAVLVDGRDVVEASETLHGEQFGPDGWIARFGKHPEAAGE